MQEETRRVDPLDTGEGGTPSISCKSYCSRPMRLTVRASEFSDASSPPASGAHEPCESTMWYDNVSSASSKLARRSS